jgi:hypothetical protein
VRLPFFFDLSEAEQASVVEAVRSFEPARIKGLANLQRSLTEPEPVRQSL